MWNYRVYRPGVLRTVETYDGGIFERRVEYGRFGEPKAHWTDDEGIA